MIPWIDAAQGHSVYLPNKPNPVGFCLKTLCDSRSKVMLSFEWVEQEYEQDRKLWSREHGRSAACTARVTKPCHGGARRLVIAYAWFGSMPTALLLNKFNLESICNVKGIRKGFPRTQLKENSCAGGKDGKERGATAHRRLVLRTAGGAVKCLHGVLHVDNCPMTLLCTTGRTDVTEVVTRERAYRDQVTGEDLDGRCHHASGSEVVQVAVQ
jgi:hypothetical protein